METLREIDSVAYIRFASVHWDFRETKDFADILDTISASVSGDGGEGFSPSGSKNKD